MEAREPGRGDAVLEALCLPCSLPAPCYTGEDSVQPLEGAPGPPSSPEELGAPATALWGPLGQPLQPQARLEMTEVPVGCWLWPGEARGPHRLGEPVPKPQPAQTGVMHTCSRKPLSFDIICHVAIND